jgi:hypothetical protein
MVGDSHINDPGVPPARYSVLDGCRDATETLKKVASHQLPPDILQHLEDVTLSTATDGTQIYFPCPFKETEATVALKSVEASVVAALAHLRYPNDNRKRKIVVDLERTATFLFSTYIATIAGLGKQDPTVKTKLKGMSSTSNSHAFTDFPFLDTDLLKAQAILYRRLSANLYESKDVGKYYHIHGSLEAGKTLNMIGLESHRPDLTDYQDCINTIESHVKQFTIAELEDLNKKEKQAGVEALKWEDFRKTSHVSGLNFCVPDTTHSIVGQNSSFNPTMAIE